MHRIAFRLIAFFLFLSAAVSANVQKSFEKRLH